MTHESAADPLSAATVKRYWLEPYATSFHTIGAVMTAHAGRPALVIRETLFYPEGGGQRCDVGQLTAVALAVDVIDVQVDDAGIIHHVLSAPSALQLSDVAPAALARMAWVGTIDEQRRRQHMRQHTAQHLLSQAMAQRGLRTVSSRLGASCCTIDVESEHGPTAALVASLLVDIGAQVYELVLQNVEIRALYPRPDEWQALGLRKLPTVAEGIRVIEVDGFDRTPCGGTHVTTSAEVGYVLLSGVERYKRGYRITFHTGLRAHLEVVSQRNVLAHLGKQFTCGVDGIVLAAAKMHAERRELETQLVRANVARARLGAATRLAELSSPAGKPDARMDIVLVFEADESVGYLHALAHALAAQSSAVVVAIGTVPGATHLLVQRTSAAAACDVPALWGALATALGGGRGGGMGDRAEGTVAAESLSASVLHAPIASYFPQSKMLAASATCAGFQLG